VALTPTLVCFVFPSEPEGWGMFCGLVSNVDKEQQEEYPSLQLSAVTSVFTGNPVAHGIFWGLY